MTATTLTLADFLLQRLAEDEAAAREAREEAPGLTWRPEPHWDGIYAMDLGPSTHPESDSYGEGGDLRMPREMALHIARHDPARVLAECEAKRAIVEQFRPGRIVMQDSRGNRAQTDEMDDPRGVDVLRALASVYSDHPDFDPAWSVAAEFVVSPAE